MRLLSYSTDWYGIIAVNPETFLFKLSRYTSPNLLDQLFAGVSGIVNVFKVSQPTQPFPILLIFFLASSR